MGRQMTAAYNDAYDRVVTASEHDRTDLTLRNTAMKTGAPRTTSHNYIGHTGHNYIGASRTTRTENNGYLGHNYGGHTYIGHNYIGASRTTRTENNELAARMFVRARDEGMTTAASEQGQGIIYRGKVDVHDLVRRLLPDCENGNNMDCFKQ